MYLDALPFSRHRARSSPLSYMRNTAIYVSQHISRKINSTSCRPTSIFLWLTDTASVQTVGKLAFVEIPKPVITRIAQVSGMPSLMFLRRGWAPFTYPPRKAIRLGIVFRRDNSVCPRCSPFHGEASCPNGRRRACRGLPTTAGGRTSPRSAKSFLTSIAWSLP